MQQGPNENTDTSRRTLFFTGILMFIANIIFSVIFFQQFVLLNHSLNGDGMFDLVFTTAILEALCIASIIVLIKYGRRTRREVPAEQQPGFARFISATLVLFSILIAIPYALILGFLIIMVTGSK